MRSIVQDDIRRCPVCKSDSFETFALCRDYVSNLPGEWLYVRCRNSECQHVWLRNRPAATEVELIYANYYTVSEAMKIEAPSRVKRLLWPTPISASKEARRSHDPMLGKLQPPGSILEVGSGSGVESEALRKLGFHVVAQDIDPELEGPGRFIGPVSALPQSGFSGIYSSHSIEHIADLHEEVRSWTVRAEVGAQCVVRTPNVDSLARRLFRSRWRGFEAPRHFQLFSNRSLSLLFKLHGWDGRIGWGSAGGGRSFATSLLQSERDRPLPRYLATVSGQLVEDLTGIVSPRRSWELVGQFVRS